MKLKHAPYYMLDSTYTIPSNPNTMRDTGPTRNAEYIIRDDIDSLGGVGHEASLSDGVELIEV